MSEGHPTSSSMSCSASTSGISNYREDVPNETPEKFLQFCVNEIPWKLVPQSCDEFVEFEFLDGEAQRVSDVESFVWKWSPCGRYGIDLPGGRENINEQLKDRLAVFDLHENHWTFYQIDNTIFDIPRVCFLYWARHDIIGVVSLMKDYEPGPDEEVSLKFKQSFYYVSHDSQTLVHAGSCKYRTNKTIIASYWYHIFENRRGEPFIDHNNDLWLVFSNGADSLILLPFIPTKTSFTAKCVSFDMNEIVSKLTGSRVFLDAFMSSHFVPWVYRNDINFFVRIDSYSFAEEHNRDYNQDSETDDPETRALRGVFQIRINLKDVIERGEKEAVHVENRKTIETRFGEKDVELWRKISDDYRLSHQCITQHGKMVVIQKWAHFTIDTVLSKNCGTRISDIEIRDHSCCSKRPRDFSFCTIDLDAEVVKKFDALVLGTDVILPHPSGSLHMFRYKEDYGMSYCELPFFEPQSLKLKCMQAISECIIIDPDYSERTCCLKIKTTSPEECGVSEALRSISLEN